ncbi:unnamed protein product [Arabis nemorensis]|uniref:Uncharacterized protein n=1 Tax=Arabis nemorensis TaxID=586526 RepID=A0A565ATA2_9BRAS|nr:unnamed protein product [Arabis nemorensis]
MLLEAVSVLDQLETLACLVFLRYLISPLEIQTCACRGQLKLSQQDESVLIRATALVEPNLSFS